MIDEFLGIAIVGVALSLVIEWIKTKFGTDTKKTKALTVLLSVVVGGLYYFLQGTVWWATILGVLGSASTFYAFFLRK